MSRADGTGFSRNASALLRSDSIAAPTATCHNGDGQRRYRLPQRFEQFCAGHTGQVDVGQYQVPGLGTGSL